MVNHQASESSLDKLILQIFEEQEDKFSFPLTTQKETRDFVRLLNRQGYTYDMLSEEINEKSEAFRSWRLGSGPDTIGRRMMTRINKPLQEAMLSDGDSEEEKNSCNGLTEEKLVTGAKAQKQFKRKRGNSLSGVTGKAERETKRQEESRKEVVVLSTEDGKKENHTHDTKTADIKEKENVSQKQPQSKTVGSEESKSSKTNLESKGQLKESPSESQAKAQSKEISSPKSDGSDKKLQEGKQESTEKAATVAAVVKQETKTDDSHKSKEAHIITSDNELTTTTKPAAKKPEVSTTQDVQIIKSNNKTHEDKAGKKVENKTAEVSAEPCSKKHEVEAQPIKLDLKTEAETVKKDTRTKSTESNLSSKEDQSKTSDKKTSLEHGTGVNTEKKKEATSMEYSAKEAGISSPKGIATSGSPVQTSLPTSLVTQQPQVASPKSSPLQTPSSPPLAPPIPGSSPQHSPSGGTGQQTRQGSEVNPSKSHNTANIENTGPNKDEASKSTLGLKTPSSPGDSKVTLTENKPHTLESSGTTTTSIGKNDHTSNASSLNRISLEGGNSHQPVKTASPNSDQPPSPRPSPTTNASLKLASAEADHLDIDENYNSDLDIEVVGWSAEEQTLIEKLCLLHKSEKNDGPGHLYVFSDTPAATGTGKHRIRIGVSRFPEKRLQQALLFNPDIRMVTTAPVATRKSALCRVQEELKSMSLRGKKGWYWGSLDAILKTITDLSSDEASH